MSGRPSDARPPAVPTIDALLAAQAAAVPDRVFLRFDDGDLTFAETDRRVDALAAGLAALGVSRGQLVAVLLPNGADFVVTWLALCRLGAVATLVNTALRGPALAHALDLTTAGLVVVDDSLVPSLAPIVAEGASLDRAVVVGATDGSTKALTAAGVEVIDHASLAGSRGSRASATRYRPSRPIRSPIRRWSCSPPARPARRRAACSPTATPCARPS